MVSFIKFLAVGMVNTCVGLFVMYTLLDFFHSDYWIATFSGNAIGAVGSFLLNRRFTFRSDSSVMKSGLRFTAVILVCYFISYKIGLEFTDWFLSTWPVVPRAYMNESAVLVGSGLYTVTNFFGQKYIVFPVHSRSRIF